MQVANALCHACISLFLIEERILNFKKMYLHLKCNDNDVQKTMHMPQRDELRVSDV